MAPSDFKHADVKAVVEQLSTDELIQLSAGVGFWRTAAIDRLGIPSIKVSDGPNGIRGNQFFNGCPAKCLPSSTALGATWDVKLVKEVGLKLLAPEAKLRAASITLAPTCNIQRNPLGGRSFESFSEDPYLSGMVAAAYVNGVQEGGIGTTIKHFFGNDKENDRLGYDAIISDRAMREIYLMPFMLAQKFAKPWSYMTAYNKVNGTHVSENPKFLQQILRDEWKFDGLVMSDWFGIYSISESLNAGLDLEMPGINKWRTLDLVNRSISARKLTTRTMRKRAENVLELVKKCAEGAPEVLDGDGIERTVEKPEDIALMRKVAAESIVLLKNVNNLLPLKAKELKNVAIVGGNARAIVLSGGGSASLKPSYFVSPYEGIVKALKEENEGVEVVYSEGAQTFKTMPSLDYEIFTSTGERGWTATWFAHESDESMVPLPQPFSEEVTTETRVFVSIDSPKGITKRWTMKLEGYLKERERDCEFEFGLMVAGRAKLFVDDELVIDNWTKQTRGESFFACGSVEEKGIFKAKAGVKHKIVVEWCNVTAPADDDPDETVMDSNPGVQLGGTEVASSDKLMDDAVALAKEADVVIAVVGLNADWETEGYDRTTLALPGRTDELIEKVVKANSRTVVVTQSGSSILLPWADVVPAVVHAWYLGNATGDAIADVLFGKHNPSGKLSLTFPKKEEDVPSFGHFHSEHGELRYAEDLFVGYKHYQHRKIKTTFPFGHGLSYTTFAFSNLQIGAPKHSTSDISIPLSINVKNTGSLPGATVIQVYTSAPSTSPLTHVVAQLKAFDKVSLQPGEEKKVEVMLDKYGVSYWDPTISAWVVEKGVYGIQVGQSSEDGEMLKATMEVGKAFEWNGL